MYKYFFLYLSMMLITDPAFSQKAKVPLVEWTLAAQLKDVEGNTSLGFAGPINAVASDALIVAGGANFPGKMPWEGGKKYYSNEIHVLQKSANGFAWNENVKDLLPEPIAYCGQTSTPSGIVYAGGENEKGLSAKAYVLNWDSALHTVSAKPLPDLPLAVTNMALTSIGNRVYAVGGDLKNTSSSSFLSLDLSAEKPVWKALPDLPIALANSVVLVQKSKTGPCIYVVGGRTKTPSGISQLHSSTLVFDLKKQSWHAAAPISDGKAISNFSAGAGVAIGNHYLVLTGGDNGKIFHKIENYLAQIAKTDNLEEKSRLIAEKNSLNISHKGFFKEVLLYDTFKNSWTKIAELPFPAQVTTSAALWNGAIFLSSGEVKPGVRSPNIMSGRIK